MYGYPTLLCHTHSLTVLQEADNDPRSSALSACEGFLMHVPSNELCLRVLKTSKWLSVAGNCMILQLVDEVFRKSGKSTLAAYHKLTE